MADTFFIAGGTLSAAAPSYIERAADRQLQDALREGEYCYVLDSRQKGKSSLMARAIERLRNDGIVCAKLDLQRFGANLDPERWYAGLLSAIGQDLGLREEMFSYWGANQTFGPLRRLLGALEEVVLPWLGERRLIIFIDEIDYVRSLPFPTDEVFAGLRELYNRRADDPRFRQIAFCLLGVATPSDLIKDVRITPFNVGKRIELTDFTLDECCQLAAALGPSGQALIRRAHYWTNGHPYLTQRLCQAIQEDGRVTTAKGVDRSVESLFFNARAREEEPNLSDVARRVLESNPGDRSSEEYRSAILDLLDQVRSRRRSIRDDDTDLLVAALKLSGVSAVVEGYLWIRNRIYYRVFDQQWVRANLPDAELQRQGSAARRAALRTASVAGGVVVAMGALAILALWQRSEAIQSGNVAEFNESKANVNATKLASALETVKKQSADATRLAQQRQEALTKAREYLSESTINATRLMISNRNLQKASAHSSWLANKASLAARNEKQLRLDIQKVVKQLKLSRTAMRMVERQVNLIMLAVASEIPSLTLNTRIGDHIDAIEFISQGRRALANKDYSLAEESFVKALLVDSRTASGLQIASVLNRIGGTLLAADESALAVSYFLRALPILERDAPGSLEVATVHGNLGYAYDSLGQTKRALGHYVSALATLRIKAPGSRKQAVMERALGGVFHKLGRKQESIIHLTNANETYKSFGLQALGIEVQMRFATISARM